MTDQNKQSNSVPASDEKQDPIVAEARRTGQGERTSGAKNSAAPEAPGDKNMDKPGDPNQGTEAR
ncbi:hypothetical protein C7271_05480 [filamentous cyanobacterium CCP5]|nr:hypothetical protein C7271_05480 [filamentous cyanobacterium CCP5]